MATPDLSLIARMADLFGVSLDALVGFSVQDHRISTMEERMHELQRAKQYTQAAQEAERALLRYPDDFRIVYRAGEVYACAGLEEKRPEYMRRSIELLEHAVVLLPQNTDPKINEISLQGEIAQGYLQLGKAEKALAILQQYNTSGVYNDLIAFTYAVKLPEFDPKAAEPYMMDAFAGIINSVSLTMMAYANYYCRVGKPAASRETMAWLAELLQSIKLDAGAVGCVDKMTASCYAQCAALSCELGETEKAAAYLRLAREMACAFDAAPTYRAGNLKFCVGDTENARLYDDLGETALAGVERQLAENQENECLMALWRQLTA